jgi:hypothetical protein
MTTIYETNDDGMKETTRQVEMAWKRGYQLGLVIGVVGTYAGILIYQLITLI